MNARLLRGNNLEKHFSRTARLSGTRIISLIFQYVKCYIICIRCYDDFPEAIFLFINDFFFNAIIRKINVENAANYCETY